MGNSPVVVHCTFSLPIRQNMSHLHRRIVRLVAVLPLPRPLPVPRR